MLRMKGALGTIQPISASTYQENANSQRSVSFPAKVTHQGLLTSSPDLMSSLPIYTFLNITWHVCSEVFTGNVKYLHKSIMERKEQLVDLSGLSSEKAKGSLNLSGKFISSSPKNLAVKQPMYSSEKGPLPAESLDAQASQAHIARPFPHVRHHQLLEGYCHIFFCKIPKKPPETWSLTTSWVSTLSTLS